MPYLLQSNPEWNANFISCRPSVYENGFSNWKNATEKKKAFQKHKSSDSHMEAVARYVTAPATVIGDIGDSKRARIERFCSQSLLTSDT